MSQIYCQCIEVNCYKVLCSGWEAEWGVRSYGILRWAENSLSVDCHLSLREIVSFWVWLTLNLFRELYDDEPQHLRAKSFCPLDLSHEKWDFSSWWRSKRVKKASLRENTVRVLQQTMPVSFYRWHRLLHPHKREKQRLPFMYLHWTKPDSWAL